MTNSPLLYDTITSIDANAAGRVVVSGSHGALNAAKFAADAAVRAVIFADAGRGLDDYGVAGVLALSEIGMAAAATAHDSARMGDATDAMRRGRISTVNSVAQSIGVEVGQPVSEAAALLEKAPVPSGVFRKVDDERSSIVEDITGEEIILIDSITQLVASDEGRVVVSGSHGGLVGGDPKSAASVDAAVLAFSDAGGGVDDSGLTRLPALDPRGVAAVTVYHTTARIGDARSVYETGVISHLNDRAREAGFQIDTPLREALSAYLQTHSEKTS